MISTATTKTSKGKAPERVSSTFEPGPSRIPTYTGSTAGGSSSRRPSLPTIPQSTPNPSSSHTSASPQSISATLAPGGTLVDPTPIDSPVAPATGIFSNATTELEASSTPISLTTGPGQPGGLFSMSPSTDTSLFGQPSGSDHGFVSDLDRSWRDPTRKKWLPERRPNSRDRTLYSTPVQGSSTTPMYQSSSSPIIPNPFGSSHTRSVRMTSSQGDTTPRTAPVRLTDAPERRSETQERQPSVSTAEESITGFYDRIRKMYILQLVRNRDLSQFSTTNTMKVREVEFQPTFG
ncbi:hypothetical protein PM082_023965 [Marasmius tenuissimus]|nr:hypothetical protein PM082_023965 [Marasmius tenuissimus]